MKNFKKIFAMAAVVLSTGVVTATAVAAGPYYNANESQTLVSSGYTTNSKGHFDFNDGAAYFDAADINNLAAAVNDCFTSASNGKKAVADGLKNVGTYFTGEGTNDYTNNATAQQKSVTYNNGASAISNSENSDFINTDNIPFSTLMDAVSHSQDIPEAVKQTQATNEAGEYLYYEDETASIARDLTKVSTTNTGYPVYYGAVKPENLSAGSAAWVNGELILGTGSDNNAYYDINSNFLNKLDKKIKYINVQGNVTASFFTSSEILPIMVSWSCWNPAGFSMGGVWDIMHCNSRSNANKNFQAQLGDGYKTALTVTPLSAYVSSSSYTKASSGDEIIGWHFKGAGNGSNKASVTVWYVECETPYYFDDIYPDRTYEQTSQSLYPIS